MMERDQALKQAILRCAEDMCTAALSAPKACGVDSIVTGILTGGEIAAVCKEMRLMEDTIPNCKPIFYRDAALVEDCPAVVLIGAVRQARGLTPCSLCGFANCAAAAAAGTQGQGHDQHEDQGDDLFHGNPPKK